MNQHEDLETLVSHVLNIGFNDYGYFWIVVSERTSGWRMEAMTPDAINSFPVFEGLAKFNPGRVYHRVMVNKDGTWKVVETIS